jgi:hypothetical protein
VDEIGTQEMIYERDLFVTPQLSVKKVYTAPINFQQLLGRKFAVAYHLSAGGLALEPAEPPRLSGSQAPW